MTPRLGGPPPAIGATIVTGYGVHRTLRGGVVVAVHETPTEWAVLIRRDGGRFEAVDHMAWHVGLWRSEARASEAPGETDAAQRQLRASWGFVEP